MPPGYGFESEPRSDSIKWQDHAVLSIVTAPEGGKVEVTRKFVYGYTILGPQDYGALRDFYQKIATADGQQLILTRSAVAAGK